MQDRNIYAGVFTDEFAQNLLAHSVLQIQETLGTAWDACHAKEDRVAVFGRCMDLVDSWNERTFAEEADVFVRQPHAKECWRGTFGKYVKDIYAGSKTQVRATIPNETAFVQTLLGLAAKHPVVRSGKYFELESSIDRKDVVMDIIRSSMATLCDEFVHQETAQPMEMDVVGPDDSASQVGIAAYAAARPTETPSVAPSKQAKSSLHASRVSHTRPPPDHRSVTIMTTNRAPTVVDDVSNEADEATAVSLSEAEAYE